jgi:hypothetical protein
MKARLMKHDGKSKITVPAEVSRYFDQELMDYVSQELTPAREIEFDLPAGSKYGGYVVRKELLVPPHAQKALYGKGFKFVRDVDEKAFLAERQKIDAEIEKRQKTANTQSKREEKKTSKKADSSEPEQTPSGDLTFGHPAPAPEPPKATEVAKTEVPPPTLNEGGK